jgi:hypothetical protein
LMSHPLGKSEQVGQVIAIFECFTVHIRFYQDRLVVKGPFHRKSCRFQQMS